MKTSERWVFRAPSLTQRRCVQGGGRLVKAAHTGRVSAPCTGWTGSMAPSCPAQGPLTALQRSCSGVQGPLPKSRLGAAGEACWTPTEDQSPGH